MEKANEQIVLKNTQIVEVEKKFNNLAVAKLSTEFASAVTDDQKSLILKRYADTQAQSEEHGDQIRSLSSDKQKSQRLLLEAKHAIDKLSSTNDSYTHEIS